MCSKARAFTLIELLVVIAIIAILASVLFPVFAKVREKARQTACLSNEQQISLAIMQYIQDYDEHEPNGAAAISGVPANDGQGWAGQVQQYLKSTSVLKCPDDSTAADTQIEKSDEFDYPISYAFNANLAGAPASVTTAASRTVQLFEVSGAYTTDETSASDRISPAGVGAISTDTNGGASAPPCQVAGPQEFCNGTEDGYATLEDGPLGGLPHLTYPDNGSPTAGQKLPAPWHTGGTNFLAADGHAKFERPSQVSPGLNAQTPTSVAVNSFDAPVAAGTGAAGNPTYALTFSTQ